MAVTEMFASQSKSKVLQLRSQLSREKKGDSSASAYYIADEMGAAGKNLMTVISSPISLMDWIRIIIRLCLLWQ